MNILMPLPQQDFDPTEVAVTWQLLTQAGHHVQFATPSGTPAACDPLMITGEGLDAWACLPGLRRLRLIGLMLRAQSGARQAYADLLRDTSFLSPMTYEQADALTQAGRLQALVLPGGHAKGMRPYLESAVLQRLVARFFDNVDDKGRHKPVAAICHGVLLAARSKSAVTGRSVLFGKRTTALTWKLERSAWLLTRFWARFWDPGYYRTYGEAKGEPAGHWSVESEVKRLLVKPDDFVDVPPSAPHHWLKTSGLVRDRQGDSRAAWVVVDGAYVSARWPGDVHTFAQTFIDLLKVR